MSRLDWFITRRMALSILGVVLVFFAILLLSESLNTARFSRISSSSGELDAWLAIVTSASRWAIKTLSVTVLIGGVVGLLEFQNHRELMVIKATGLSIWRAMRGPVMFVFLFGLIVTFALETASTSVNRDINPTRPGLGGGVARSTTELWLAQTSPDGPYYLNAKSAFRRGQILRDVSLFPLWETDITRINATRADYQGKRWVMAEATITHQDGSVETEKNFRIRTRSTVADLRLVLGSTEDFTFYELVSALENGITEPVVRAAATTRFLKLLSLPVLLVGSLLIAFAFTAGYRRDNNYGLTIVYGIVLGFVVFVITEMADRAGSSGVLDANYATWGPAVVSILIGVSVLLHKEDGRA
ncbi:MAG: LptF/LptG family permease [Hyphomicrobiaceae bacterium]|nr:LptF/LptG family permease [Hyphomicrobiaceae bacterium]MCC0024691.1 LptF/LptG family permease [Hyphomicrobiaceae bacterium]